MGNEKRERNVKERKKEGGRRRKEGRKAEGGEGRKERKEKEGEGILFIIKFFK